MRQRSKDAEEALVEAQKTHEYETAKKHEAEGLIRQLRSHRQADIFTDVLKAALLERK